MQWYFRMFWEVTNTTDIMQIMDKTHNEFNANIKTFYWYISMATNKSYILERYELRYENSTNQSMWRWQNSLNAIPAFTNAYKWLETLHNQDNLYLIKLSNEVLNWRARTTKKRKEHVTQWQYLDHADVPNLSSVNDQCKCWILEARTLIWLMVPLEITSRPHNDLMQTVKFQGIKCSDFYSTVIINSGKLNIIARLEYGLVLHCVDTILNK